MSRIQLRQGLKSELPKGLLGEPLFCTDTNELYIGKGENNDSEKIGVATLDELTDVLIDSPSSGQVLEFDGSKWTPKSLNAINGNLSMLQKTQTVDNGVELTINHDIDTDYKRTYSAYKFVSDIVVPDQVINFNSATSGNYVADDILFQDTKTTLKNTYNITNKLKCNFCEGTGVPASQWRTVRLETPTLATAIRLIFLSENDWTNDAGEVCEIEVYDSTGTRISAGDITPIGLGGDYAWSNVNDNYVDSRAIIRQGYIGVLRFNTSKIVSYIRIYSTWRTNCVFEIQLTTSDDNDYSNFNNSNWFSVNLLNGKPDETEKYKQSDDSISPVVLGDEIKYDTSKGYLITTSENSYLNTDNWSGVNTIVGANTIPDGTYVKYLISFDDKVTWKKYNGSVWIDISLANINSQGMLETEIEALTSTEFDLIYSAGKLDLAICLGTTDNSKTPELTSVTVSIPPETYWESLPIGTNGFIVKCRKSSTAFVNNTGGTIDMKAQVIL